jgi:hypothetical protein
MLEAVSSCSGEVVDLRPTRAQLLGVAGDPFAFRLTLRDPDGDPIDVALWDWRATVTTGPVRLDFEWAADDSGVSLWMRGDDTARIPTGREFPYDVACRQPTAGEGMTVLSGEVFMLRRTTDALRSDPDLIPAEAEPVPA